MPKELSYYKQRKKQKKTFIRWGIFLTLFFLVALLRIGVGDAEWAGMTVSNVTENNRVEYHIPDKAQGVVINWVEDQAYYSGVKEGDLVTAMNGKPVRNIKEFLQVAKDINIDDGALLDVIRDHQPLFITLKDKLGLHGTIKDMLNMEPKTGMHQSTQSVAPNTQMNGGMQVQSSVNIPVQSRQQMQQVAFNPGCATNPTAANCFPNMPMQQVAFAPGCATNPTAANCFPASPMQQVALKTPAPTRKVPTVKATPKPPAPLGRLPTPKQQKASKKILIEGHWLGMELIPLTPELAQENRIPPGTKGLLVDEISLESAETGILAGDMVVAVDGVATPDLVAFTKATRRVKNRDKADVLASRRGKLLTFTFKAGDSLGFSQNEAAQPIMPGALSPHRDRGKPCTACHIIMRSGGQLATDAGDILPNPPPIPKNAVAPHKYRGKCKTCHVILKK